MQRQLVDQRRAMMRTVLKQAVDRGELDAEEANRELWDLLPGYLIFRSVIQDRPATRRTVRALVDDMIMPSVNRRAR
jgi:polyhydroxyalkanoate synthesis regulator phasin